MTFPVKKPLDFPITLTMENTAQYQTLGKIIETYGSYLPTYLLLELCLVQQRSFDSCLSPTYRISNDEVITINPSIRISLLGNLYTNQTLPTDKPVESLSIISASITHKRGLPPAIYSGGLPTLDQIEKERDSLPALFTDRLRARILTLDGSFESFMTAYELTAPSNWPEIFFELIAYHPHIATYTSFFITDPLNEENQYLKLRGQMIVSGKISLNSNALLTGEILLNQGDYPLAFAKMQAMLHSPEKITERFTFLTRRLSPQLTDLNAFANFMETAFKSFARIPNIESIFKDSHLPTTSTTPPKAFSLSMQRFFTWVEQAPLLFRMKISSLISSDFRSNIAALIKENVPPRTAQLASTLYLLKGKKIALSPRNIAQIQRLFPDVHLPTLLSAIFALTGAADSAETYLTFLLDNSLPTNLLSNLPGDVDFITYRNAYLLGIDPALRGLSPAVNQITKNFFLRGVLQKPPTTVKGMFAKLSSVLKGLPLVDQIFALVRKNPTLNISTFADIYPLCLERFPDLKPLDLFQHMYDLSMDLYYKSKIPAREFKNLQLKLIFSAEKIGLSKDILIPTIITSIMKSITSETDILRMKPILKVVLENLHITLSDDMLFESLAIALAQQKNYLSPEDVPPLAELLEKLGAQNSRELAIDGIIRANVTRLPTASDAYKSCATIVASMQDQDPSLDYSAIFDRALQYYVLSHNLSNKQRAQLYFNMLKEIGGLSLNPEVLEIEPLTSTPDQALQHYLWGVEDTSDVMRGVELAAGAAYDILSKQPLKLELQDISLITLGKERCLAIVKNAYTLLGTNPSNSALDQIWNDLQPFIEKTAFSYGENYDLTQFNKLPLTPNIAVSFLKGAQRTFQLTSRIIATILKSSYPDTPPLTEFIAKIHELVSFSDQTILQLIEWNRSSQTFSSLDFTTELMSFFPKARQCALILKLNTHSYLSSQELCTVISQYKLYTDPDVLKMLFAHIKTFSIKERSTLYTKATGKPIPQNLLNTKEILVNPKDSALRAYLLGEAPPEDAWVNYSAIELSSLTALFPDTDQQIDLLKSLAASYAKFGITDFSRIISIATRMLEFSDNFANPIIQEVINSSKELGNWLRLDGEMSEILLEEKLAVMPNLDRYLPSEVGYGFAPKNPLEAMRVATLVARASNTASDLLPELVIPVLKHYPLTAKEISNYAIDFIQSRTLSPGLITHLFNALTISYKDNLDILRQSLIETLLELRIRTNNQYTLNDGIRDIAIAFVQNGLDLDQCKEMFELAGLHTLDMDRLELDVTAYKALASTTSPEEAYEFFARNSANLSPTATTAFAFECVRLYPNITEDAFTKISPLFSHVDATLSKSLSQHASSPSTSPTDPTLPSDPFADFPSQPSRPLSSFGTTDPYGTDSFGITSIIDPSTIDPSTPPTTGDNPNIGEE